MFHNSIKRRKLFVDVSVQGALIGHAILYWFTCLVTLTLLLFCWQIITGPVRPFSTHWEHLWFHNGPALVASLLLLPMVVLDLLRLSNRFVGPLVRLRGGWKRLASGEPAAPIHFRKGDFWQEFADHFNATAARIEELEAEVRSLRQAQSPQEQEPVAV